VGTGGLRPTDAPPPMPPMPGIMGVPMAIIPAPAAMLGGGPGIPVMPTMTPEDSLSSGFSFFHLSFSSSDMVFHFAATTFAASEIFSFFSVSSAFIFLSSARTRNGGRQKPRPRRVAQTGRGRAGKQAHTVAAAAAAGPVQHAPLPKNRA
jgi:hypothetical protein